MATPSTASSIPYLCPSTASSGLEPRYLGPSHTPLQPSTLQDTQTMPMPNGESGHYSPTTLQELELENCQAPSRKRKPGPKSQNGEKSPKKSRKSTKEEKQLLIQKEIEELSALEKENHDLANEEMALKQKLHDMQKTYLEYIKNKQIIYVENPTSPTSLPLSPVSSNDGESSPMRLPAPAAWAPPSRGTSLLPTPDTTPPSSPEDVLITFAPTPTSCDVTPCLPDELFLPVPVIQHSTSNLPTEWAVPHLQEGTACSQDQALITSFVPNSGNSCQDYVQMDVVSTPFPSTSPQTQELPSGDGTSLATLEIIDLNSINSYVVDNVL